MTHPLVHICVLNWNKYEETAACLRSLFELAYPNFRIVVIDNGSTDGSLQHLQAFAGRIDLISNLRNLGYTGGNNPALLRAARESADYVWLLNNDTIAEPDSLSRLVAMAEADSRIGLASPVLYYEDPQGAVWNCGASLNIATCQVGPFTDIAEAREFQRTQPFRMGVYGTAMLVRRALIEKCGVLDDDLFAYCEDIDYSMRSIQAGFRNAIAFDAAVYHKKEPELGGEIPKPYYHYLMTRNRFLLLQKHAPGLSGLKGKVWHTRQTLHWLENADAAKKEGALAGLWDVWLGVKGRYDSRRRMAQPFRLLLGTWPRFWRRLLDAI